MKSLENIEWMAEPFPHAIVDNFLNKSDFKALTKELNRQELKVQSTFNSSLEKKNIYLDSQMGEQAKSVIRIMGGKEIKRIFSEQFGVKVKSMGDTLGYSGYSPFHVTKDGGLLGSHVDHSDINDGAKRHIANTIFYASNTWEKEWGGETIFFSKNGMIQKSKIEPIPNRLILFAHSAHSFHGVNIFNSKGASERRTFYHDYYIDEKDIDEAMISINLKYQKSTIHSNHSTTFVPFLPFGINSDIDFSKILSKKNFDYIFQYIIYRLNRKFKTRISVSSTKNLLRKLFILKLN